MLAKRLLVRAFAVAVAYMPLNIVPHSWLPSYPLSDSSISSILADYRQPSRDISGVRRPPYSDALRHPPIASLVQPASASESSDAVQTSLVSSIEGLRPVNLPSDDFWYPPYLIGRWKTDLKFTGAEFAPSVPLKEVEQTGRLPGFKKYSVFFNPNIGNDASCELRYVQLDSHPREDHPHNVRSLVQSLSPSTIVDQAAYSFQKAPNWLYSPANTWKISFHDDNGRGEAELRTRKRRIESSVGKVKTIEYFTQNLALYDRDGKFLDKSKSDYAIQWEILVPSAEKDEFMTVDEIGKAEQLVGHLNIFVFFQPTDDLYLQNPVRPAGVFSYEIQMNRLLEEGSDIRSEVARTLYPFIPNDAGPIELDKYFGY